MIRITSSQIFEGGLNGILDQQYQVFKTQQQIATGQRIVVPSDDPAAAASLVGLEASLASTRQYDENANTADERLALQDAALLNTVEVLQRARELAVRAVNDTNSAEDRGAMAREVRLLLDQALGIANSKDSAGEYMFGGFQSKTEPAPMSGDGAGNFSYTGDQGQRMLQIGSNRQVAVNDPGSKVFMKIEAVGGGYQDMFTTLYNFATDLESDSPDPTSIEDLDNAIQNILNVQAENGARRNSIDVQRDLNSSLKLEVETAISNLRDLDYADAVTRLNRQMLTLEFAQKAFAQTQNLSLFNFL